MINQEQAREWVAAMESGWFNHGTKEFESWKDGKHCHCSLGVLCTVVGIPTTVDDRALTGERMGNWLGVNQLLGDGTEALDISLLNDRSEQGYQPVIDYVKAHYLN